MIEQRTVEESKFVQRVEAVTCDLCKCRFTQPGVIDDRVNWSKDPFTRQETIMEYRTLQCDIRFSTVLARTTFHICPDCFIKRLVPWVKEQSVEPTTSQ